MHFPLNGHTIELKAIKLIIIYRPKNISKETATLTKKNQRIFCILTFPFRHKYVESATLCPANYTRLPARSEFNAH